MLVDAHCHLHDPRICDFQLQSPASTLSALVRRAAAANVTHVVSCACFAADWDALEALMAGWESVCAAASSSSSGSSEVVPIIGLVPSFGLHPWWASDASGDVYVTQLRALLERHPTASVRSP